MVLLKEVKNTKNKGLIGIIESGKEILLSTPTSSSWGAPISEQSEKAINSVFEYNIIMMITKKDKFYQIGKISSTKDYAVMEYKCYKRRE